jgi:hypothetical protein
LRLTVRLSSLLELAYGYAKRAHELIAVIERLLEPGDLVESVVLTRGLTETVGAGHLCLRHRGRDGGDGTGDLGSRMVL